MKFICNFCNYSTDTKFCYEKHLKTRKHQEKVNEIPTVKHVNHMVTTVDPHQYNIIQIKNEYRCEYCNNLYKNQTSLSRHRHACVSKKTTDCKESEKEKDKLIKELRELIEKEIAHKNEIIKSKDETTKSKDETILFLAHENKNLKTMLNCAGTVVEKSMSNLSYVNKHYPNAPALEYITDIADLHEDLSEDNVVDNIIYEYKNHTLVSFIGNLIIKDYKKTDPTQQSLWNSDADRLTYMIRSLLANESIQWEVDKKGVNTTKYIIKPITDYIKKQLENYITTCEVSRSQKTKKIMGSVYKMADCRIVIASIDNGELSNGILKYISPYLYIVKENQELL